MPGAGVTMLNLTIKSLRRQRIPSPPVSDPWVIQKQLVVTGSKAVWLPLGLGLKALRTKVRDLQATCRFRPRVYCSSHDRDCRNRGRLRGTQTNSVGGYPERKMSR